MGGDDQWGNIVAGMELVRRIEGREVFAVTSPLVTRSDGKKMGKTEKGALYLDPGLVSPYEFYQYWMNIPDADVGLFLRLFTFLDIREIARLEALRDRELNEAKEVLACELTSIVHGKGPAGEARETSRKAFGEHGPSDLDGMPSMTIPERDLAQGIAAVDLFARSGLCGSKSEARRLITQGGAYVNNENVSGPDDLISKDSVSEGTILLRAGKKRYYKIIVTA